MIGVDDISKFPSIYILLIDPHLDTGGKTLEFLCIVANDPGNSRAPECRIRTDYDQFYCPPFTAVLIWMGLLMQMLSTMVNL